MPSSCKWIDHTVTLTSGREIELNVLLCPPERNVGIYHQYWDDWKEAYPMSITTAEETEIRAILDNTYWTEELA